jgi:membrane protein DedA with SNARE-associated domain/membrane-associated phospholipid phosphatase
MVDYIADIARQLGPWAYLIIYLVVMLECQPLLGLFMPGETLVVASGFLAREGVFDLKVLIAVIAAAAVVGDTIGYELGRRLGRGWLQHYGHWFGVREKHLARVDTFFARHGGKSVFFSHFLHLLRALMPFMAGAGRVPYLRFAFYNTLGCILWATIFVVLGYFFGQSWEVLHRWAGRAGAVLGAFVFFLLALAWIWGWIARNEMELWKRWSMFLQRPRVADLNTRVTQGVDLLCKRLTPAGYLALHMAAGAFVIIFVSWSFGAIASNAEGHRYLLALDHKISFWFQEHSTRPLITFAANVSHFGSPTVLTIASFATGLFLVWQRSWDRLLLLILAMGGGGVLCAVLRIFHRTLPFPENPLANLPSETFPSWHAMGSTLFYGLLAVFIATRLNAPRWRALTFLIAGVIILLIALTRIYLGAHYVTDVIGAIAAGLAWLIWCQIGVALMRRSANLSHFGSSSSASS